MGAVRTVRDIKLPGFTIPKHTLGSTEGDVVPDYSVWVNFGRLGRHPISLEDLMELPSDPNELYNYLLENP